MQTLEQGVTINNKDTYCHFEDISHLVLVSLLLTLNKQIPAGVWELKHRIKLLSCKTFFVLFIQTSLNISQINEVIRQMLKM